MLNALKLALKSRAFVVSALVLGVSAVGLQATAGWLLPASAAATSVARTDDGTP